MMLTRRPLGQDTTPATRYNGQPDVRFLVV